MGKPNKKRKTEQDATYIDTFLQFLTARDEGKEDLAKALLDRFMAWSTIQQELKYYTERLYKHYGMPMCGPLYAVVSRNTMKKELEEKIRECFWNYHTFLIEKDENELAEILQDDGRTKYTAALTSKLMEYFTRSVRDAWRTIVVEKIRPYYPGLTNALLKSYVRLRQSDVDLDNTDEEWIAAIQNKYDEIWTERKCYNIRCAFLPPNGKLENEEYYRSISYGTKNFYRVRDWQKNHPDGDIQSCVLALGLTDTTVKKYWEYSQNDADAPEKERYLKKAAVVIAWRQQHPSGTEADCHMDTRVSLPTIRKYWNTSYPQDKILELTANWQPRSGLTKGEMKVIQWREEHPDGSPAECMKETGLSGTTVYGYWNMKKK